MTHLPTIKANVVCAVPEGSTLLVQVLLRFHLTGTVRPKGLEKTTPNSARNVCDFSQFLMKFLTISNDLSHQLLV
jgi:hypothetical protein